MHTSNLPEGGQLARRSEAVIGAGPGMSESGALARCSPDDCVHAGRQNSLCVRLETGRRFMCRSQLLTFCPSESDKMRHVIESIWAED